MHHVNTICMDIVCVCVHIEDIHAYAGTLSFKLVIHIDATHRTK